MGILGLPALIAGIILEVATSYATLGWVLIGIGSATTLIGLAITAAVLVAAWVAAR